MPRFDLDRLDRFRTRLDADVVTGLIAGADVLVGGAGGPIWRATVGFRDVASRDPLRQDAVWRIFSMTKVLVSAAAMALMERGLLRLDQPVAEFIPAFTSPRVMDEAGAVRPAEAAMTVQDLLRHTAGLGYGYLGDGPLQRLFAADGFLAEDLGNAAFVERLASLPLAYEPGTVWHYSHATDVLGRVLELAGGKDLQGVLDGALLGPLGMADTRFRLPPSESHRVAEPLPQAQGRRPVFGDPCRLLAAQRGNGGLVSTTEDYARFLAAMLTGGGDALSPAAVRLMTADHLGAAIGRAPYYPPGPGYGFGLGVAVRTSEGEAPFPGSVGDWFWSGVGGTYAFADPARGFFALMMLQTSDASQRLHYRSLCRAMVYASLHD